jgi:hypothetical protein
MEYGFSASLVAIRVTVGTSSNGSGTITGAISFNALIMTNSNAGVSSQGSTLFPCYASGDAGEFRMLLWIGNATAGLATFFGIERSKDATGAKTVDYFTALNICGGGGSPQNQQTTLTSGLVTPWMKAIMGTCVDSNTNTGSFNGTVAAFPVFPFIGKIGDPMLGVASVFINDVADNAIVTVSSMYGSTHTYVSCKSGTGNQGFQRVGSLATTTANAALLMRYE